MPDMIGAELALDPICGPCKRACHYCRIVDQNIDALDALIDSCSSVSNGMLVAEVQSNELSLDVWISTADTINDSLDLG